MSRACAAVGLSRATAYRRLQSAQAAARPPSQRRSKRRLSDTEQAHILQMLDSKRFSDRWDDAMKITLRNEQVRIQVA